ncbi:MAG: hypothetical protein ACYC4D_01935 [Thermoleophilia bacterium]
MYFVYLVLALLNISLLLLIIRWRGLFSPEGIGIAYLTLLVASDFFGLLLSWGLEGAEGLAPRRMEEEIYPSAIHILGVLSLAIGLFAAGKPRPKHYQLPDHKLRFVGLGLTLIGIVMKLSAMVIGGVRNPFAYLNNLYLYDSSVRELGFLDQGVLIAILGLALTAAGYRERRMIQGVAIFCALVIGFMLSVSKSSIMGVLVVFLIVSEILHPKGIRYWMRSRWVMLLLVLFIVGLGVKTQIKYQGVESIDYSPGTVVEIATTTVMLRIGPSGLHEGYTNLVNRISEEPWQQFRGTVVEGTVLGVVPRFIWNNIFDLEKPEHPFHAKGYLINTRFMGDELGNDAPTLVGFAFADFGISSVVVYLFVGGWLLGLIRRMGEASTSSIPSVVAFLTFINGFSFSFAESGFLNLFYYLGLSASVGFLAWALIALRQLVRNAARQRS